MDGTIPECLVVVVVPGCVEECLPEGGYPRGVREHLLVHRLTGHLRRIAIQREKSISKISMIKKTLMVS